MHSTKPDSRPVTNPEKPRAEKLTMEKQVAIEEMPDELAMMQKDIFSTFGTTIQTSPEPEAPKTPAKDQNRTVLKEETKEPHRQPI